MKTTKSTSILLHTVKALELLANWKVMYQSDNLPDIIDELFNIIKKNISVTNNQVFLSSLGCLTEIINNCEYHQI